MRASKVIEILTSQLDDRDDLIYELRDENRHLREALLAAAGQPAAAIALRPRKEDADKTPVPRPIGL